MHTKKPKIITLVLVLLVIAITVITALFATRQSTTTNTYTIKQLEGSTCTQSMRQGSGSCSPMNVQVISANGQPETLVIAGFSGNAQDEQTWDAITSKLRTAQQTEKPVQLTLQDKTITAVE